MDDERSSSHEAERGSRRPDREHSHALLGLLFQINWGPWVRLLMTFIAAGALVVAFFVNLSTSEGSDVTIIVVAIVSTLVASGLGIILNRKKRS